VDRHAWSLQRALLDFLEKHWAEPDEGIWEVRGPRRDFVHSKVMAWVAFDRAAEAAAGGLPGPAVRWRQVRDQIHAEVTERGYNSERGAFTQYSVRRPSTRPCCSWPSSGSCRPATRG
jgi:GH15 family glucan-1,4-alpha-glucosidase